MTQDEKRVKIAEACGYSFVPSHDSQGVAVPEFYESPDGERLWDLRELPDYFGSLDEMHEAEERFMRGDNSYWFELLKITDRVGRTLDWRHFGHATAAQRAEAFGLTLKLWKAGQ